MRGYLRGIREGIGEGPECGPWHDGGDGKLCWFESMVRLVQIQASPVNGHTNHTHKVDQECCPGLSAYLCIFAFTYSTERGHYSLRDGPLDFLIDRDVAHLLLSLLHASWNPERMCQTDRTKPLTFIALSTNRGLMHNQA